MKLKNLLEIKFVRFLLTGGLNTALTYFVYLILMSFLPYIWSYSISYVCGIFLSFMLSRFFVFKEHQGLKSALLFPFVYLAQYILGVVIVWLWVNKLLLSEYLAPLAAIALTLPLTFVLSKLVFVKSVKPSH